MIPDNTVNFLQNHQMWDFPHELWKKNILGITRVPLKIHELTTENISFNTKTISQNKATIYVIVWYISQIFSHSETDYR